jgi:hypothetical protein
LDANQQHSNLYTDAEWGQIKHAVERYTRIKSDLHRHRTEWLQIIGPTLVMVRAKAFEVAGTTNVTSQAYRDAIGEELRRTGLNTIEKAARSYLLKIMDNLSEVEAWLAERPNPDRLNHPKTIWKAFEQDHGWEDDPGADPDDEEEYLGPWLYEGNETGADQDDSAEDGDQDDRAGDGDGGDQDDSGAGAGDADDDRFPNMDERAINTIGELKEYIEEAMRRGAKPNNRLYIEVDDNDALHTATVHFVDDDGPGAPPFMIISNADEQDNGDGDQESDDGDDPITTKVDRDDFKRALKKSGNDLRKVKLKAATTPIRSPKSVPDTVSRSREFQVHIHPRARVETSPRQAANRPRCRQA